MKLQILTAVYLPFYLKKQPYTLQKHFERLKRKPLSLANFDFYFSTAAVYSSIIEGNPIDASSYWKYRESGMNTSNKSFKEIQDLIKAYQYAQEMPISWRSLMRVHKLLSAHLLKDSKKYQGKLRDKSVGIYDENKNLIYTAVDADKVKEELKKLLADVKILCKTSLSIEESFYYASALHLKFSQIHPFADGNGRTARLLEKWFLAQKLGKNAWFVESEKHYQKSIKRYYRNINLGSSYTTLNEDLCLPFLRMLPEALRLS